MAYVYANPDTDEIGQDECWPYALREDQRGWRGQACGVDGLSRLSGTGRDGGGGGEDIQDFNEEWHCWANDEE